MPDSNPDSNKDRDEAGPKHAAPSRWEYVAAALGAAIILGCVAYLGAYAVLHPGGQPDIVLRIVGITPGSGGHHVRFEATNAGNSTAASVTIAGALKSGGQTIEESDVTFDYLPQQSVREATLVFREPTDGHELELRVTGFAEP